VSRRDPEPGERLARRRDVGVGLGVDALAAFDARLQQSELLQLARARRRDPRPVAEPVEVDSSSSRITRSGRNSSRCRRRIVSSRSTSCSEKSR
jgi:hypothetical protein